MDNSAQTTIYSQVCHLLISELRHLYKMVLDITFVTFVKSCEYSLFLDSRGLAMLSEEINVEGVNK